MTLPPLRVLVVDDEPLARERMRSIVLQMPAFDLVGLADTAEAAWNLIQTQQPDALLLDIAMPGFSGLDLARHLGQLADPPSIVFVTAYPEHGADAFELNAVDYLLKPVRRERLEAALARIRQFRAGRVRTGDDGRRAHIVARLGGVSERIHVDDVLYLLADEKYVSVRHAKGEALIEESLKSLEEAFPGRFLRIHRNCLVQPRAIQSLKRDGEGRHWLHLHGVATALEVSRRNVTQVREAMV